MREKKLKLIHPGEILREEFLVPLQISQYRLAAGINVPLPRINEIVNERRSITADTALRLARFFGTSEQFWLNLQARYDLDAERDKLGKRLLTDVIVFSSPAREVFSESSVRSAYGRHDGRGAVVSRAATSSRAPRKVR